MNGHADLGGKCFSFTVTEDVARIEINTVCDSVSRVIIRPCDYAPLASDAFAGIVRGRHVVLAGRGPVEAYFALGYYSRLGGARTLACEGPDGGQTPIGITGEPSHKPWIAIGDDRNGRVRVTLKRGTAADGKWNDTSLDLSRPAVLRSGETVFSGPGSVAMYALLGASAAQVNIAAAWIDKPGIGLPIGFSPEEAGRIGCRTECRKSGVVIGIVGDPNSGKSVFSKVFSYCVRKVMPQWYESWIYDCDFASPTPDWYLANVTPETAEKYKAAKGAIKANWTEELEDRVRCDLNTMRGKLDFVIADMPGGRHPKAGEDFAPMRIPSRSRADMLAECDAFVVLCKADYVLDGWKRAFAQYGLDDRIVAVVTSSNPDDSFACESHGFDGDGVFHADIRGLDRKKNLADGGIISALADAFAPLVRHLSFAPVVAAACAGVTKAFLTKDGGTRYGAAVRSAATGKIYSAGQYASWNHTTNIHAEMSALVQASSAGDPDVDVLAVACSSSESASPCGVCRQVMSEHARRTGRDFDVVFVSSVRRYRSLPVTKLMTDGWVAHPHKECSVKARQVPDEENVFSDAVAQVGGECLYRQEGTVRRIMLVWDTAFQPGVMLVKSKYAETPVGFVKLPHAFADASRYRKYTVDEKLSADGLPGGVLLPSDGLRFANPRRIEDEALDAASRILFARAGIVADSVRVMCSRATAMNGPDSDYDLVVAATPEQIGEFREVAALLHAEGAISLPRDSRSWQLICAQYPGAAKDNGRVLLDERRYTETFQIGDRRFSVMFTDPEGRMAALPESYANCGFVTLHGRLVTTRSACYKRSVSLFQTTDNRLLRVVSYAKTANLLKDGDVVSVSGLRLLHDADDVYGCGETLLQMSTMTDKIVWMR